MWVQGLAFVDDYLCPPLPFKHCNPPKPKLLLSLAILVISSPDR